MSEIETKSKLEMQSFYFPEYSMKFSGGSISKVSFSHKISYLPNGNDRNQIKVQILTTIVSEEKNLELSLTALGTFRLDGKDLSDKTAEQILKKNTVSIMFPFVRSQVSLLTTQPGLVPILLQPIDVNALVDGDSKKSE